MQWCDGHRYSTCHTWGDNKFAVVFTSCQVCATLFYSLQKSPDIINLFIICLHAVSLPLRTPLNDFFMPKSTTVPSVLRTKKHGCFAWLTFLETTNNEIPVPIFCVARGWPWSTDQTTALSDSESTMHASRWCTMRSYCVYKTSRTVDCVMGCKIGDITGKCVGHPCSINAACTVDSALFMDRPSSLCMRMCGRRKPAAGKICFGEGIFRQHWIWIIF